MTDQQIKAASAVLRSLRASTVCSQLCDDVPCGCAQDIADAALSAQSLVGVERALPPLRAREEIARLHEILKELAEPLNYRQFTKWNPQTLASEALTIFSRTAWQEWRDITGAPKDGTFVDLWHIKMNRRVADCRWRNHERPDHRGWYAQSGGLAFNMGLDSNFSHYRLLPAPPVAEPIVAEKQTEKS